MPQLLVGLRTFLLFYARVGTGHLATEQVGVVEIVGCEAARFGPPNDEALENHQLWGQGLEFDAAHRVEDSYWSQEWGRLAYRKGTQTPPSASGLRHFIFTFHDETIEVIGTELKTELFDGSMTHALLEASRRLAATLEPLHSDQS